jgi:hypothetical protein
MSGLIRAGRLFLVMLVCMVFQMELLAQETPDPEFSNFDVLCVLNTRNYEDGIYNLKLSVIDDSNKESFDTISIEFDNFYQAVGEQTKMPDGVIGVPLGGTYEYKIASNAPKAKTWHVINGDIISSTTNKCVVKWYSNAPLAGKIYYTHEGNFESKKLDVGIFKFIILDNVINSNINGTITDNGEGVIANQGLVFAKSGDNNNYAYQTDANIKAIGPTIGNILNYGINNLRVGYIQNGNGNEYSRNATYENNAILTHPISQDTRWYIDKSEDSSSPWYNPDNYEDFGYSPGMDIRWINLYDNPMNAWPKFLNKGTNGDNSFFISKCNGWLKFRVFIVVTTTSQFDKIENFVTLKELNCWSVDFRNGSYTDKLNFPYANDRIYKNSWSNPINTLVIKGSRFETKMSTPW